MQIVERNLPDVIAADRRVFVMRMRAGGVNGPGRPGAIYAPKGVPVCFTTEAAAFWMLGRAAFVHAAETGCLALAEIEAESVTVDGQLYVRRGWEFVRDGGQANA